MTEDAPEPPAPPDGTAVETLRTTRAEAQDVLARQLETLDDVDDKAMRTVRITLVVLSILVSATAFRVSRQFVNAFTVLGMASLVLAVLIGLWTYGSSSLEIGTSREYVAEVLEAPYSEKEWLAVLLAGYHEWIEDVSRLNATNARLLTLVQGFAGLGIVLISLGVLYALVELLGAAEVFLSAQVYP